jgi:hypothetical protein
MTNRGGLRKPGEQGANFRERRASQFARKPGLIARANAIAVVHQRSPTRLLKE